jgi:SAM-dependent methyltransferase
MRLIQRLIKSLRQKGLWITIKRSFVLIEDFYYDIKYETNTFSHAKFNNLTIESDNKERGVSYQPARVAPLKKLFRNIRSIIPADSVFVDFGCGKGRVLLIASQFGFKEVRGVEFARELCKTAENNCAVYKAKRRVRVKFQIIELDVVNYSINTDENVFFMFNPFDEVILKKVVNNITESLRIQRRKIFIIYCNPIHGNFFDHHKNFVKWKDFDFYGYKFSVYSNND